MSCCSPAVRLLLPITNGQGAMEDTLESFAAHPSQAILIKYVQRIAEFTFHVDCLHRLLIPFLMSQIWGSESSFVEDSLMPTLLVPSSILKKGKLEILVSS